MLHLGEAIVYQEVVEVILVYLHDLVKVLSQLEVLLLDDLVDLILRDLQLLLVLFDLSLLDPDALLLLFKFALFVLNLFELASVGQLLSALIILQPLLATFDLLVEVKELLALRFKSLVVGVSDLHMHVQKIVEESEDFEEHGESVLAHETQLDGRIEQRLPELVVTDCEAT